MKSKNWKQSGKLILAFGVVLTWLVCIWNKCSICFETNDDRLITEIIGGVIMVRSVPCTCIRSGVYSAFEFDASAV